MKRHDITTLSQLFADHARSLMLYARAVLPAGERDRAEDVVHDVFVDLLAQGGSTVPDSPAAWLHRCVRNACLDTRRSAERRRTREQFVAGRQAGWFEARSEDLIDAHAAQAALATLPDVDRHIVVLRLWSGLSLAEAGEVVGLPTSTVHDRFRNAISQLRRILTSPQSVSGDRHASR